MRRGIRSGELDILITIQRATVANDDVTNEEILTWSDVKTKMVKELNPQTKEQYEANQQVAVDTVRWFGRVDAVINEKMRCVRDGVTYYISGIQNKRREGYMVITAERRDNRYRITADDLEVTADSSAITADSNGEN